MILAVALIGVLGLAIDTGIMLSSRAQLERSSQQAALASMSRFLLVLEQPITAQYTASQRYTDAINQSRDQAQAILRLNPFLGATFRISETQWALSSPIAAASGAVGTIEFGKYYVEQPPTLS